MMSSDKTYEKVIQKFVSKNSEFPKMYEYCNEVAQLSLKLMNEHLSRRDWKLLKERKDGSRTWSMKHETSPFNLFKGEKIIKVTNQEINPFDIIKIMSRIVYRFEVDKDFQKRVDPQNIYHRLVHPIEGTNQAVCHGRYASGYFFVKDRDAVYVRYIVYDEKEETAYLLTKSITKEEYVEKVLPVDKDCVRGEVILYGWSIRKLDEEQYRVSLVFHGNLGGLIPPWLYNKTMHKQVDSISNMCEWIESEDFFEDSNIRLIPEEKKST